MCHSFKRTKRTEVIGYKVVAKGPNGRYLSLLTGNMYPKAGRKMPVWRTQHKAISRIHRTVLDPDSVYFKKQMMGRTAVFKDKNHAYTEYWYHILSGLSLTIVRVRLTCGLRKATYNGCPVYCGRKMEVLDEC